VRIDTVLCIVFIECIKPFSSVALQRESYANALTQAPVDLSSPVSRRSQLWPPIDPDAEPEAVSGEKHKKRRNGLAKIWRIVTGSSKTYPVVSGRVPPPYERNEDDLPLAPPPPLSYLVERGPSELGIARHGSTASLQSTTSPKNALSSPGTAPSTVLPSPISSRRSGMDRDVVIEGRIQNGYYDDHEQSEALADEGGKSMNFRKIHSVISEPDILQRVSQNDLNKPTKLTNPYPVSVMSREKSLPPLPGEVQGVSDAAHVGARPRTMFAYDTTQMPFLASETQELLAPFAPFRNSESRRQSFGGMASPPNAAVQSVQTVPNRRGAYNPHELGPEYNEFGSSRRSLGRLEHVQEHIPEQRPSTPSSKRKSRFGFSLLLGRKHDKPAYETGPHVFPSLSRSGSDQRDDTITNTHARSRDGARMSMTSRKAVEELVSQDTEFVAYRYPSSDQRLDILR
jgi:hypothetical protein